MARRGRLLDASVRLCGSRRLAQPGASCVAPPGPFGETGHAARRCTRRRWLGAARFSARVSTWSTWYTHAIRPSALARPVRIRSPAARQARRITARHAAASSLELNLPATVPSRRSISTWRATAPSWEPMSPRLCPMDRRSPATGRHARSARSPGVWVCAPATEQMERTSGAWSSRAGQGSSAVPQQARVSRSARPGRR